MRTHHLVSPLLSELLKQGPPSRDQVHDQELPCHQAHRLTAAVVALASEQGRYGYKKIAAMLQRSGWQAGRDRVERIWRREGLKVPQKQRPRKRLWLNDGSCIRLRPERANHVWSYDFVNARTHDGRLLRILALIDEYTRECLALRVARRLNSQDVIETLSEVMLWRGIPEPIRSDNGPEFVARQLRDWLQGLGTSPLYIESGSPWGERVLRELQWEAEGGMPEWGDLLLVEGGTDRDRAVAAAVQPGQTARRVGV